MFIMKNSILLTFLLWLISFTNGFGSGIIPFEKDTIVNGKKKRMYYSTKITNPPKIDGILDDECWKEGDWSGGFKQFIPSEGSPASQKTELKVLYDEYNIYIAIRAYDDEPAKVDRQMGRRDAFVGDIVGVCFDSYFDQRTGYEFDLTASGVKLDILLYNGGWDVNWNAVWYGKVGNEDSAWVAEMQVPLSQIRYDNKDEQVWGMHSWRWINRNQEEDQWNLMSRDNDNYLHHFGIIQGINNISKSRKIEFLPYSLGKVIISKKEEGNPFIRRK